MAQKIRRIVTGHDEDGKSMFLIDGISPNVKEMESMPGLALTDLWETTGTPASNTGNGDCDENGGRPQWGDISEDSSELR